MLQFYFSKTTGQIYLKCSYKIGCTLSLVLFEADPDLDPDSCSMTSYPFFGFSAPVRKLYTKMFIIFVGYGFVVIPSSKVQYLQCWDLSVGYLLFTVKLSKRVDIVNVGRGFAITDCLVSYAFTIKWGIIALSGILFEGVIFSEYQFYTHIYQTTNKYHKRKVFL